MFLSAEGRLLTARIIPAIQKKSTNLFNSSEPHVRSAHHDTISYSALKNSLAANATQHVPNQLLFSSFPQTRRTDVRNDADCPAMTRNKASIILLINLRKVYPYINWNFTTLPNATWPPPSCLTHCIPCHCLATHKIHNAIHPVCHRWRNADVIQHLCQC